MPSLLVHLTAAKETARHPDAPKIIAQAARAAPGALLLGSILPDLPYHGKFGRQLLRHLFRRPYLTTDWGDLMHSRRTGRLALSLLAHRERSMASAACSIKIQALVAGYLSHYALDQVVHPAINQLVRQHHRSPLPPPNLHNRIEHYQSLLYHRDLLGYDLIHSPYPKEIINQIEGTKLIRPRLDCCLWFACRSAMLETHGRAPSPSLFRDWLWGVTAYGHLMSSAMGKWERPKQSIEQLRGTFYQGPDANLEEPLSQAITLTLNYWHIAETVIVAEKITKDVRAAFLKKIPDIDFATGY